jgi:uroporphyrinogen decarboxylase
MDIPPIWLMRQAGRYLPEYRELRAKAGGFLDLCYNPDFATEVTLQPLRRFEFDAAILFADILLIPHALALDLQFLEGEGPKLSPVTDAASLAALKPERLHEHLAPVYETVRRLREALEPQTTLIGFAGAPWTVATYMLGGKGPAGQDAARLWGYRNPDLMAQLLEILVTTTSSYLQAQIRAGANVVQIFDSWSGGVPSQAFNAWCVRPTRDIVNAVREEFPDIPIIGFPKGAGPMCETYAETTGINAIGVDTGMDPAWAVDNLQNKVAVQGNLDPMALVAGGEAMEVQIRERLAAFGKGPYVFNLGHGIVPQTPPEHVARLVEIVKNWDPSETSRSLTAGA